ncbi:polyketide synthetase [Penicillium brevicompactum]|uniref:polyketide synthetase n=1 Tax=Penicillium brevicompactum TaxID=5074 RepID=UPI0025414B9C|nr:polyketide synthetase [Penicillium brevicompactum]KAJ5332382.1 polyketide synthetase [Penicillium brevicompactum]
MCMLINLGAGISGYVSLLDLMFGMAFSVIPRLYSDPTDRCMLGCGLTTVTGQFRIFNAYGPTECSFSSNELEVAIESQQITAGKALPNYAIHVVDEELSPLPIGFPGEICISGAGVAIGYLNSPGPERRFLKTSFSERAYRTGDRGVLHADGALEILGRIDGDTQVKLWGLRIELQDIEHAILKAANGLITESSSPLTLAASLPLPQYMRPTTAIAIDRIPLTNSGKIDRKALQALPLPSSSPQEGSLCLTSTENRLAKVWESVLPAQPHGLYTLTPTSDFFSVGGNSMLLIELRNVVRREYEIDFPLLRLFEYSTLSAMASAIHSTSEADKPFTIDWVSEAAIPSSLLAAEPSPLGVNRIRRPPQVVLLTGATGRPPLHAGDLALPNLGLSSATFAALSSSADAIIHNGADVSFLKTYESLRAANVDATKTLVEMALPRNIPVHLVSTGTVGKLVGGDSLAPESLAQFSPSEWFKDGYAASKWVSEVFLENIGRDLGLPVVIHRPSSITGDGADEMDVVANVLRYANLLKAVPESAGWTGAVDLVSVEKVVQGIIGSVFENAEGIAFVHHSGEKVVPAGNVGEILTNAGKDEWEILGMQEWVEQAVEKGMNPLIGEFLKAASRGQGLQIGQRLL